MKQGIELWAWAYRQVEEAGSADMANLAELVAKAYLQGGIDALADEIGRLKAIPQADGSPA